MDGLIALLSLGAGVAAWWWVAKWLGAKGKGVLMRHGLGMVAWFLGTTFLFGMAQAVGLVDPPEPAEADAAKADAEPAKEAEQQASAPGEAKPAAGKPVDTKAGPINATLDVQVPQAEAGPHLITGTTNLPDGTQLMVSINSKSAPGDSFQSKTTVQAGKFKAGPFGKGSQLPLGHYEADVTMPIPAVQPEAVQAVIGKKGENLTGDLVEQGDIGVTVERVVPFTLGGDKAPKAEDAIKKAEALLKKVEALEVAMRAMKGPRQNNVPECMKLLHKYQPEAEKLRDEAMELPMALRGAGVAAGHLVICTCLKDGEESCELARKAIVQAKADLKDAAK